MLIYAAMFNGRQSAALGAANRIVGKNVRTPYNRVSNDVLCNRCLETTPQSLLHRIPNWVEAFLAVKYHVMIRFGLWREIIDEPLPIDEQVEHDVSHGILDDKQHNADNDNDDDNDRAIDDACAKAAGVLQVSYATALYAKALAHATRAELDDARRYRRRFERRRALIDPERYLFNNRCVGELVCSVSTTPLKESSIL
jgi:hypothetical protein